MIILIISSIENNLRMSNIKTKYDNFIYIEDFRKNNKMKDRKNFDKMKLNSEKIQNRRLDNKVPNHIPIKSYDPPGIF